MESEEKLFTLYLLFLIWLHVSARHPCAEDEKLEGGECQPCPVCPDGQQLSTVCGYGAGAGAECVSCPPDHYSNADSNHRCTPCTNCTALNAEYRQLCSPGTAAVCGTCLPGHAETFKHCHPCAVIPNNLNCRQWLADQMAQKTTPPPGSEANDKNKSVVIPVVSSICGVVFVLCVGGGIVIVIAKKWKCSSCKSTKGKNRAATGSAPEDHTLLPMERPRQPAIPDQPTPYTDDPSVTSNSANGHIASVSHGDDSNNSLANQTLANRNIAPGHVANGNIPSDHMANGNLPSAPMANGNLPSTHMANGNLPSAPMANGNIPSAPMANGNIPSAPMANGNLPSAPMANGNLPSAPMANGNIPSAPMANGAVTRKFPIRTHPRRTQIGDTLPISEAPSEVAEMVETENLQGAEPYTSLSPVRTLQQSEVSVAPNPSPLTSVSSSPMVTATPGNRQHSSSPVLANHGIPAFPNISAQEAAGNDPTSRALPYGLQNYHSGETWPIRDQEMPERPPYERASFLPTSAQNVASWSLLQGETSSRAPPDDTINPSPSLTGAVSDSSDMEDLYHGRPSATDFSSFNTQNVSPKSLLRERSTGPLPEADGAPSTDSDQSEEDEPRRNARRLLDGDSFPSNIGEDRFDRGRELSIDQSREAPGQDTSPGGTQRDDGRNRAAGALAVDMPEPQRSNRQMTIDKLKELKDEASNLMEGVKVGDLDRNIWEALALLLNPELDSPGVKTWRHFAREFQIDENLINNWHGLCEVLNYLAAAVHTVPEVIEAVFKINRLDATEKLCQDIIDQSKQNTRSGQ